MTLGGLVGGVTAAAAAATDPTKSKFMLDREMQLSSRRPLRHDGDSTVLEDWTLHNLTPCHRRD